MDSTGFGRRRFLKQAAALTGVAAGAGAGAEWAARGQPAPAQGPANSSGQAQDAHVHINPSRRGARMSVDHITYYTPLQDYAGIITPAPLHFVQQHSSEFPDIDPQQHRLTIHGMVDRPLSFTMDDLKRLPSVSRIHFLECHGNSSPAIHGRGRSEHGVAGPVHPRDDQLQRMDRRAAFRVAQRGRRAKRRRPGWFRKGRTRASSLTPFRWQRPWTTCWWPTARMASRCASSRVTRCG